MIKNKHRPRQRKIWCDIDWRSSSPISAKKLGWRIDLRGMKAMVVKDSNADTNAAPDLAKAKAEYDRTGYCVIPNVLSPAEVAALRTRIEEQAAAEKALGWAYEDAGLGFANWKVRALEESAVAAGSFRQTSRSDDGRSTDLPSAREVAEYQGGVNQRIYFLVNKGKILRELVTHPVLLEMAKHALGRDFLLCSHTANIAKKGAEADGLHRDAWWCPVPYREGETYVKVGDRIRNRSDAENVAKGVNVPPAACNMAWMLTDFTEENGATRLVPETHLIPDNPDSSIPHRIPTVPATGKAGSCLFFDGRVWHATGQNFTDEPRIAVLTHLVGPQFRQLENYFIGLDPAVLEEASDKLLDLLGYATWRGYGGADTLTSSSRLRAREPWIGEMRIKV